jgi:predicted O-methyltransferase YrrM
MANLFKERARHILFSPAVRASRDIDLERQRQAVASSAAFINERMPMTRSQRGENGWEAKLTLFRWAIDQAPETGLALEFGVASGVTMREIAKKRLPAHGFDSFEGLPEDWRAGFEKATFAQELPEVGGAALHVGWFDETLPSFLREHTDPFAFVHLDADLYSSTKTVFDLAFDRFVPGTIIVFDEYFNYPGWEQHEHKAFEEFLERYAGGVEYLAYNGLDEQLVVKLT